MPMYRSFLALTIAALTGFATAVHADNGATARSTAALPHAGQSGGPLADRLRPPHGEVRLAELRGQGELGKPCHAEEVSDQGGSNHIYCGDYKDIFGHLSCSSPAGGISIVERMRRTILPRPPAGTVTTSRCATAEAKPSTFHQTKGFLFFEGSVACVLKKPFA